jgi:FtsP/CotA-like multicopper oxidase with cupredoxin domain
MPMVVMEPFPSPAAQRPTTPEAVIGQDSYLVSQPYRRDTLTIVAGQRFETIVEVTELGGGLLLPHPQP